MRLFIYVKIIMKIIHLTLYTRGNRLTVTWGFDITWCLIFFIQRYDQIKVLVECNVRCFSQPKYATSSFKEDLMNTLNGCKKKSSKIFSFTKCASYTFESTGRFNLRWLLGFRKLRSSKKVEISQFVLVLRVASRKNIIFFMEVRNGVFPYFHY